MRNVGTRNFAVDPGYNICLSMERNMLVRNHMQFLNLNDNDVKDRCEKLIEIYPSHITSSLATKLILIKKNHGPGTKEF